MKENLKEWLKKYKNVLKSMKNIKNCDLKRSHKNEMTDCRQHVK